MRGTGSGLNEPARLVDEWIAFLEQPKGLPSLSWHLLEQRWNEMRDKGKLVNCGLVPVHLHQSNTALNILMPQPREAHNSVPAGPSARRHDPNQTVVKLEEDSDGEPPAELAHASLNKTVSKRKRRRSESPETPGSHQLKRRANEFHKTDEAAEHELQVAEPFQNPTHQTSPDASAVQEEEESRSIFEHHEASTSSGKSKTIHSSTRPRVTACEEKLADHTNLIQTQNSKSSVHEEMLVKYGTQVEVQGARVESLERKHLRHHKAIKELQKSVVQLTDGLDNLGSHASIEVKKELEDIRDSFEVEQAHINRRVDTFRDDLAVQKARTEDTEDAQKAADEYIKFAKKNAKSEKLQLSEFNALSTRVTELEKQRVSDEASLNLEHEGMGYHLSPHAGPNSSNLGRKLEQLEKMVRDQEECNGELKAEVSRLGKALESNHASCQKQFKEHANRLAGQWRWINDLMEKVWPSARHGSNPSPAPAKHDNQQHYQSQNQGDRGLSLRPHSSSP